MSYVKQREYFLGIKIFAGKRNFLRNTKSSTEMLTPSLLVQA